MLSATNYQVQGGKNVPDRSCRQGKFSDDGSKHKVLSLEIISQSRTSMLFIFPRNFSQEVSIEVNKGKKKSVLGKTRFLTTLD